MMVGPSERVEYTFDDRSSAVDEGVAVTGRIATVG